MTVIIPALPPRGDGKLGVIPWEEDERGGRAETGIPVRPGGPGEQTAGGTQIKRSNDDHLNNGSAANNSNTTAAAPTTAAN